MAGQPTSSRNATFVWTMPPCCAWFCSIRWWLLSWSIFPSTCVWCRAVSFISCVSFFRLLRMERCDSAVSTNYINITLPNPINLKPRQIEDGVSPLFPMMFVLVIRETHIFALKGIKLPRFQGFAALLVWSHSEGGLSTVFAEAPSSGSSRIQTFDEHNDMERCAISPVNGAISL